MRVKLDDEASHRFCPGQVARVVDWVGSLMRCRSYVRSVLVTGPRDYYGSCDERGNIEIHMPLMPGCITAGVKGAPPVIALDWMECLVSILAHEMTHAVQHRRGFNAQSAWRSEMEAEAWALLVLGEWRRR